MVGYPWYRPASTALTTCSTSSLDISPPQLRESFFGLLAWRNPVSCMPYESINLCHQFPFPHQTGHLRVLPIGSGSPLPWSPLRWWVMMSHDESWWVMMSPCPVMLIPYSVGKTILKQVSPNFTIFTGGMITIPSHGWFSWHCPFSSVKWIYKWPLAAHWHGKIIEVKSSKIYGYWYWYRY